jgi:hypothetical protein
MIRRCSPDQHSASAYFLILIAGVPSIRASSPYLAYSVCFYVLVNITTYFSVRDGVIPLFKKEDRLDDLTMHAIMMTTDLLNVVCVPLLAWFDAPKAVHYFVKWATFQVRTV